MPSEFGSGSKFVSVHPDQDSLRFVSTAASYSLKDYIIEARRCRENYSGRCKIYPKDGSVTVETGAFIRTLEDATLLVNREERFHQLFDATINIQGRL